MRNRLRLPGTWTVSSGSGSGGVLSSLANLLNAADNLAKEQASAIIDPTLAKKLKKLTEYTHLLVENFPKSSDVKTELRVEQKEGGKLWERVRSELYSTRIVCDQLSHALEFLAGQVQNAEKDKASFENRLCATFAELYTLDDQLKYLTSRLVSPKTMLRIRMSSVIDVNSTVAFLRQLEHARMSNTLMVILFHLSWIKECKSFLPQFVYLSDQFYHYHGDRIRFMRVNMKVVRCKRFRLEIFPTVVVIKSDGQEAGRVSIGETIIVPAFVTELKGILGDCLGVEDDGFED